MLQEEGRLLLLRKKIYKLGEVEMSIRPKITRQDLIIILFLLILPFVVYSDLFINGTTMFSGDGLNYAMQDEVLRKGILDNGEIPLWNRYVVSGTPYLADIQNHLLYPIKWLLILFPMLVRSNIYFLIHISLAGIFMYFLLRYMNMRRCVAVLGGVLFMFSNNLVLRVNHITILSSYVWLPLIFLFIMKSVDYDDIKYLIIAEILMGLQFFAGFPQIAFYSCIYVYLFYLFYSISNKRSLKKIFLNSIFLIIGYCGFIAIQAIPLVELMLFSGREKIDFTFFIEYSYDLRELITCIFPKVCDELIYLLPSRSGMDLELYLGMLIPVLVWYKIIMRKRDFWTCFLFTNIIIWGIISAAGTIPFLGRILFRIPLFNSFRILSRAMFLVVFSVILLGMRGLHEIDSQNEWKRFKVFTVFYFAFLLIAYIILVVIGILLPNDYSGLKKVLIWNSDAYYTSIIVYLLFMLIVFGINKKGKGKVTASIILLTILSFIDIIFLNVGELYKTVKWSRTQLENDLEDFIINNIYDKEVISYRFLNNIENWTEFAKEPVMQLDNNGIYYGIPSIGGYITFNNPSYNKLFDIEIGMPIRILPQASKILKSRNDILSMLSCKYIIQDNEKLPPKTIGKANGIKYEIIDDEWNQKTIEKEVNVYESKISLSDDSKYRYDISLEAGSDLALEDVAYIDLYDVKNGTNVASKLEIKKGENHLTGYLIPNEPLEGEYYLRVVLVSDYQIELKRVKVEQYLLDKAKQDYKKIYSNSSQSIYENLEVKPILFSTDFLEKAEKEGYMHDDHDYSRTCYVEGVDLISDYEKATIENITVKNNYVSGIAFSENQSFVNMSQCYYPGWRAYVDGKRVPLYKVNGIIQGCKIDFGQHFVEFKFKPLSFYLGAGITGLTITIWIIFLYYGKRIRSVKEIKSEK